jgi:predicted dehydrogenase
MPLEADDRYGLPSGSSKKEVPAPELPYRPADPKSYRPKIALIGCGGITVQHLRAYQAAGYQVAALCDIDQGKAREQARRFYPQAAVYSDYRAVLARDDIEVLDIATHPEPRAGMFGEAIAAGKHILSQKPFVTDLDFGMRLVELAEKKSVRLAVNQNGRWAPHWSYIRQAVERGLLGEVASARLAVDWDLSWVAGSAFEDIGHLVFYDFAIHWFDIVCCFLSPKKPLRISASVARAPAQTMRPPLLAQAIIAYADAQASLDFNAATRFGEQDSTFVSGTLGTAFSSGPDLNQQALTLATAGGLARPALKGAWFPDGFHGTMGELLCAVEEKREPSNSARNNLRSLELCFAAIASAEGQAPVVPGMVRRLPGSPAAE